MSSDVGWHIRDKAVTNAEAWFNKSLRPRKPEGSLGRTAQDGHLDSHTAPELWLRRDKEWRNYIWQSLEEGAGKRCSKCDSVEEISLQAMIILLDFVAERVFAPVSQVITKLY